MPLDNVLRSLLRCFEFKLKKSKRIFWILIKENKRKKGKEKQISTTHFLYLSPSPSISLLPHSSIFLQKYQQTPSNSLSLYLSLPCFCILRKSYHLSLHLFPKPCYCFCRKSYQKVIISLSASNRIEVNEI